VRHVTIGRRSVRWSAGSSIGWLHLCQHRPVTIEVYTDGACLGNPGPGGWAWAVLGGAFGSGADPATTNQRMEVQAALEAVKALADADEPIEIVSDSTYVVNCFNDQWWKGWLAKGWMNSQRKPVANRDLWEPLILMVRACGDITFRWVKGHSGDPGNDLVDRLAVEAAERQEGRAGDRPPTSLGPADAPTPGRRSSGAVASVDAPAEVVGELWPDGVPPAEAGVAPTRLVVLGATPQVLGVPRDAGQDHERLDEVRDLLADHFAERGTTDDALVVLTGLRLGAEMAAAEAALEVGLPFVAVLPYPEPAAVWASEPRQRFDDLLAAAESTVVLDEARAVGREEALASLARRDAWLVASADVAVLVGDPAHPDLAVLHALLAAHLPDDALVVLLPAAIETS